PATAWVELPRDEVVPAEAALRRAVVCSPILHAPRRIAVGRGEAGAPEEVPDVAIGCTDRAGVGLLRAGIKPTALIRVLSRQRTVEGCPTIAVAVEGAHPHWAVPGAKRCPAVAARRVGRRGYQQRQQDDGSSDDEQSSQDSAEHLASFAGQGNNDTFLLIT